jgi:hypothetical protein
MARLMLLIFVSIASSFLAACGSWPVEASQSRASSSLTCRGVGVHAQEPAQALGHLRLDLALRHIDAAANAGLEI